MMIPRFSYWFFFQVFLWYTCNGQKFHPKVESPYYNVYCTCKLSWGAGTVNGVDWVFSLPSKVSWVQVCNWVEFVVGSHLFYEVILFSPSFKTIILKFLLNLSSENYRFANCKTYNNITILIIFFGDT